MYCNQCGNRINKDQKYCPNCGAPNISCRDHKAQNGKAPHGQTGDKNKPSARTGNSFLYKKLAVLAGTIAAICAGALVAVFAVIPALDSNKKSESGVNYSPEAHLGYLGYVNGDVGVSFIDESGKITAIAGTERAAATPDYSKYIFMDDNDTLWQYISDDEKLKISDGVDDVLAMSNDGVFYGLKNEVRTDFAEVVYYEFNSEMKVDIGMANLNNSVFSNSSTAFATVDQNSELLVYGAGDEEVKNLGDTNLTVEVCAVADNGEKVIWGECVDDECLFYMADNGVSKYIASVDTQSDDPDMDAVFFNNGDTFVITAGDEDEILIGETPEDVRTVDIDGKIYVLRLYDGYGTQIDSDDDTADSFYVEVVAANNMTAIYHIPLEGEAEYVAASDESDIYFSDEEVYYSKEKNMYAAKRGSDGHWESAVVAENIDDFCVPGTGDIAYVVKNKSLYYCDTAGDTYDLQLIGDCAGDTLRFVLTDKADTIYYYVTNEKSEMGGYLLYSLYKYTADEEIQMVSDSMLYIQEPVSAETPYFFQCNSETEGHGAQGDLVTVNENGETEVVLRDLFSF